MQKQNLTQNQKTSNLKAVATVADSKALRPGMSNIYFDGNKAVASDGYILAHTPADIEKQARKAEPYTKLKTYKAPRHPSDYVKADGNIESPKQDMTIKPAISDQKAPPFDRVIEGTVKPEEAYYTVALSLQVLEKLVRSMKKGDQSSIRLSFHKDPLKAIRGETPEGLEYVLAPYKYIV